MVKKRVIKSCINKIKFVCLSSSKNPIYGDSFYFGIIINFLNEVNPAPIAPPRQRYRILYNSYILYLTPKINYLYFSPKILKDKNKPHSLHPQLKNMLR